MDDDVADVLRALAPSLRIRRIAPLSGGLRHPAYRIEQLEGDVVVVKRYAGDPEGCRREAARLQALRGVIPVPDLLHVHDGESGAFGPYLLLSYVEGITFRELTTRGDRRALHEAACSVGRTLAHLHRLADDAVPGLTPSLERERFLANAPASLSAYAGLVRERLGARSHALLRDQLERWGDRLSGQGGASAVVHGDFNKRNVLVREADGRWDVAALLDWECAHLGSPLRDVGSFLRYEWRSRPSTPAAFLDGYVAGGGRLPSDWQSLARATDLERLIGILADERVPDDVVVEVVDLVRATPEFGD